MQHHSSSASEPMMMFSYPTVPKTAGQGCLGIVRCYGFGVPSQHLSEGVIHIEGRLESYLGVDQALVQLRRDGIGLLVQAGSELLDLVAVEVDGGNLLQVAPVCYLIASALKRYPLPIPGMITSELRISPMCLKSLA